MDDSSLPTDADATRRPEARGRRRVIVAGALTAAFFVIVALCLAYKSSTSDASANGEAAAAEGGANAGGIGDAVAGPTTTQLPAVLPNPGVASGTCKMQTYTPPAAKEKQQGELCRPIGSQRDTAVIIVHGGAGIGGTYAGMKPWSNRLNTEGYVTFSIDYHLFTEG